MLAFSESEMEYPQKNVSTISISNYDLILESAENQK
jgi:hypothetical protein